MVVSRVTQVKGGKELSIAVAPRGSPIHKVLTLLQGVRQTGQSRWMARCPAHEDRHPSLSIAEGKDGRVLIYCQAGCPTPQVLKAIDLDWPDLFPGPAPGQGSRIYRSIHEEREGAKRRALEVELQRRLDSVCRKVHQRLCVYVRAIHLATDDADLATLEELTEWVHALPLLEHLLDGIESEDIRTRLSATREGLKWLMV